MELHVLGPLEVVVDGESVDLGAPKQRALLLDLILHANEPVPVDRLVEDVWGESAPISFDGSAATIHTQKAPLVSIQRAARKLDGMGVRSVALAGVGWGTDACFAFWQGYFNPKKKL